MGKKTKKNRFSKTVDVDVVYSTNTIAEVDPIDAMAELNISKEKAEEIRKIKAKLTQGEPTESELDKLPTEPPFRAFVHNVAYSATESDVSQFFSPLQITNINMVGGDGGSRGFCFVDFTSRDDLAKALTRSDSSLAGRSVLVRVAASNNNERSGGGWTRDRNAGPRRSDMPFERRRGGYRPAGLQDDDLAELGAGDSGWKRGDVIGRGGGGGSGSGFGSRPQSDRLSQPYGSSPFQSRPMGGSDGTPAAPPSAGRPRINLLPRSTPIENPQSSATRNTKIFGEARPVDTASKDLHKLSQQSVRNDASVAN